VVLLFANATHSNPKEGLLRLLAPDRLADIQAQIIPGAELEIMEGARTVAICQVVATTEDMPAFAASHSENAL